MTEFRVNLSVGRQRIIVLFQKHFPKQQVRLKLLGRCRLQRDQALRQENARGQGGAVRTALGSCRLGNQTFGKIL